MKRRNFWIAFAVVALVAAVGAARLYAWMNPSGSYNLGANGLALDGYDPVAYFQEGGGAPLRGEASLTAEHQGRVYRFANEANRARFVADPAHYEPQFGGWCAYAVANGYKFHANPESFVIQDGRLLVFYEGALGDARSEYQKGDAAAQLQSADGNWQTLRGN
jgi:YHS domain-containing protein